MLNPHYSVTIFNFLTFHCSEARRVPGHGQGHLAMSYTTDECVKVAVGTVRDRGHDFHVVPFIILLAVLSENATFYVLVCRLCVCCGKVCVVHKFFFVFGFVFCCLVMLS